MNQLEVDPKLRDALAAAGVRTADDLLAWAQPSDAHNVGAEIHHPVEGTTGRFYVKAYRYPGWRKSKGLLGRGTVWGPAPCVREFRNLRWLRAHDVPAVRPIAAASRSRGGRLTAHALLTEWIADAPSLATVLACNETDLSLMCQALGVTVAGMHRHNFVHRDLYARNILVRDAPDRAPDQAPETWLLDCRRGGRPSHRKGIAFDLDTLRADLSSGPQWEAFRSGYDAPV